MTAETYDLVVVGSGTAANFAAPAAPGGGSLVGDRGTDDQHEVTIDD